MAIYGAKLSDVEAFFDLIWGGSVDKTCNSGHHLKMTAGNPYSGGSMRCDICKRSPDITELNRGFARCAACGYDVCTKCFPVAILKSDEIRYLSEGLKKCFP